MVVVSTSQFNQRKIDSLDKREVKKSKDKGKAQAKAKAKQTALAPVLKRPAAEKEALQTLMKRPASSKASESKSDTLAYHEGWTAPGILECVRCTMTKVEDSGG